jgi:choline dehydrogenase-like flavoprotein
VFRLDSDAGGRVVAANYYDGNGSVEQVRADAFVVACQAVETCRLLLLSRGPRHPNGLANKHAQVGKNLLFSAGGAGTGQFFYDQLDARKAAELRRLGPFVNRSLQDWYFIDDDDIGRLKGGTIEFLFRHPNPISRANAVKWDSGRLVWGRTLKQRLESDFTEKRDLRFEVFCDWLPNDDCNVSLDRTFKDHRGAPVARIKIGHHPHDLKVGEYVTRKGYRMLEAMGAAKAGWGISGDPPVNLIAGGCRFGTDPRRSVLNPDCRAHDVENLYVTDGSFMPTGGSVPYTWTIYANAFRVADRIRAAMGGQN